MSDYTYDYNSAWEPPVPTPTTLHPGQAKPLQKMIGRMFKGKSPAKIGRRTGGIKRNVVKTGKFY